MAAASLLMAAQKKIDARNKPRREAAPPSIEESGAVSLSEDALALQFARENRENFRWSPGMDWMANQGSHWSRDDRLERYAVVRRLCRQQATQAEDAREGKRLSSAKTVASVVTMAQSDPAIVLPASAWDSDLSALNTPTSVVDLKSGRITRFDFFDPSTGARHEESRGFFTQLTRVSPASSACPVWFKFIKAVFLDDDEVIEFVQRLLGYLLTGDRSEQKLFFFYGLGANGKSTLIDLVAWILGTYAIKLPASVLMQSPVERHPTELAQLRGKRLAISSELDEGQFWAESRIKELTGDEVLTARFMRGDFFEFAMTQTHVIVGNYKPRLRGGDAALARRFVLVPFLAKFEGSQRDPDMLGKLRDEAPAILQWMIDGAVKWHEGGLAIPASVSTASREYLADNDDVMTWVGECCAMSSGAESSARDLYASFTHWIKARGQHAPSQTLWGSRLSVISGITKRVSNGVRYVGIRLNLDEADRLLTEASRGYR